MFKIVDPFFNGFMRRSRKNYWGYIFQSKQVFNLIYHDIISSSNDNCKENIINKEYFDDTKNEITGHHGNNCIMSKGKLTQNQNINNENIYNKQINMNSHEIKPESDSQTEFLNLSEKNWKVPKLNSRRLLGNEVAFTLTITEDICNKEGKVEIGLLATIIDLATSIVCCAFDINHRMSVSVELSSKLINSEIGIGSALILICKVNSIQSNYCYTTAEVLDNKDLNLIACFSHTKYMYDNIKIQNANF